ncbi:hypothetical protein F5Y19DRAFT_95135 [Xylariaceae sp. FL1651]|nr:hypothetical protein F5Y19DRAFT_95135 [Xylariaceae sp. FL1651]
MAGFQFFSNWQLWEQLTFVLAAGIVVVFFIGWIKLWWMQRLLNKHALLDEEKRVRQMELRKSGLPISRRADIPFGVRAIQSGVEVEGIWISRPDTPVETRSASKASSTTLAISGDLKDEEKGKTVPGSVLRPTTTVIEVQPTPKPSPRISPTSSVFDRSIRQESSGGATSSPLGTPSLGPQYSAQRPTNRAPNETQYFTTTIQPESIARPHIETYTPTSSSSSVNSSASSRIRPTPNRNSSSSEEGISHSNPYHLVDARGRPPGISSRYQSPFGDPGASILAIPSVARGKYCSRVRAESSGNLFESPETDRASNFHAQSASRPQLASTRPAPVRIYTNSHENTSSRRVNAGFEVLPAGTFSRSSSYDRAAQIISQGQQRDPSV